MPITPVPSVREREWLYRPVLQLYPPEFRASFEREMVLVYRDQQRDGVVDARFWGSFAAEVVGTAPRLWFEELRDGLFTTGTAVKTMAILAVLVGALETFNSLAESRGSSFGSRDPLAQAVLILAIAAAVLLTTAGLALLCGGASARRISWIGAVFCMGTFVLMATTRPMMSGLATLVGVGFPAVLMAFLYARRDRAAA